MANPDTTRSSKNPLRAYSAYVNSFCVINAELPKTTRIGKTQKVGIVQYADDFIITASSKELLESKIKPIVDQIFPLEKAVDAFDRMKAGEQFGKIIVEVLCL